MKRLSTGAGLFEKKNSTKDEISKESSATVQVTKSESSSSLTSDNNNSSRRSCLGSKRKIRFLNLIVS